MKLACFFIFIETIIIIAKLQYNETVTIMKMSEGILFRKLF